MTALLKSKVGVALRAREGNRAWDSGTGRSRGGSAGACCPDSLVAQLPPTACLGEGKKCLSGEDKALGGWQGSVKRSREDGQEESS